MIVQAIVLAAGRGLRLGEPPKPLQRVGGAPLVVHAAWQLVRAGVRRLVVVVGPEPEAVGRALSEGLPAEIAIELVSSPRWEHTANGMSLLAAASTISGPCALAMADHLFEPGLVERVLAAPGDECILGVDRVPGRCFDLEDATKVRLHGDRVAAIGKGLDRYDAIDTGIFRISPELVAALRPLAERGDCSLSEGVQVLADAGRMRACDVGALRWLDVDTPQALEAAEHWLSTSPDGPRGVL
jgi:1L-myo-inositol 1-phosphate cytidylyltransferase